MKRDDSEWVNSLFAASAGDWTPAPAGHAAGVLYAPVSRDPEASWRCVSVLSDIELQRADRFVTEDGKAHFKQRRAFRRYCGAFVLGSTQPLSQAEVKAVKAVGGLARVRTFCQLWSLKEAALKSIGEGLPFGLDAFEFELAPNLSVVHAPPDYGGPERLSVQIIQGTDICAALVIRSVV